MKGGDVEMLAIQELESLGYCFNIVNGDISFSCNGYSNDEETVAEIESYLSEIKTNKSTAIEYIASVRATMQAGLIEEYNANLERLNKADRLMAQSKLSQFTLDKWLNECRRIMDRQNEILSHLDNDLYKDDAGFLYQDVPPLQDKEGLSFFRGNLEALLDKSVADERFLEPYYVFEVNKQYRGGAGTDKVIVICRGGTDTFSNNVVFTRQELIEAFKVVAYEDINTVVSLILSKKIFGNGTKLLIDGEAF